jgi:ABC-type multidrug transport system fused ATPase/permease subunit
MRRDTTRSAPIRPVPVIIPDIASPPSTSTSPSPAAPAGLRRAWQVATFGTRHPRRRVAALALLGALSGFGETAVIVLVIALVSGHQLAHYPLADQLPSSAWTIAALALGVLAVLAVAHFGAARLAARTGADVQRTAQSLLVASYLDAPWPAQAATRMGELQDLATVKANILAYGAQETAQGLASLVNLLVVVAAAIALSPYAAAGLLGALGVVLLIARPLRNRRLRVLRASGTAASSLALEVTETARAARDLRVFGVTAAARDRLGTQIDEVARRSEAARLMMTANAPLTRDATIAMLVLGLAVLVTQAGVGLAALTSTVVLIMRALANAQSIAGLGIRLQERDDNLRRIEASLAAWRPRRALGTRACPSVEKLTAREVTYTHAGSERPALDRITLELTRGELVGIVGRTGAGKSTLAGALLGLLEPDEGAVLADGVSLRELDPRDWHARTAWVGQEPHLLTTTVRENIRFLRPGVGDDAILEAARSAGLGAELERWPAGLDHPVGPGGGALSGGERQRIALARALAGCPDILVLDEPTSALDAHAEAAVRQALERLRHDLILVVIAHRVSTVRTCDRIAVVESGRIRALGAPAELERGDDYFEEVLALARA